jgi:hypothetical protein
MAALRGGSRPQKPSAPAAPALPPAREVEVEVMGAGPSPDAFSDVEAGQPAAALPPRALLSGTELERSPERRGRPVPVVKPGVASPLGSPGAAAPSSAGAPPKPVPVVKPQKRATIGDMLRASRVTDVYNSPAAPAPVAPTGAGHSYAAVPEPAGRAAAPRPVHTGSPYGGGRAAAPASVDEGSTTPVQYNADGSVVLSSKPIKLVKPAHLLPKTYGGCAAWGCLARGRFSQACSG